MRERGRDRKGIRYRNGEPGPPRHRLPTTPKPPNAPPDTPLPCEMRDMTPISENLARGLQSGRRSRSIKTDSLGRSRRRTRVPTTATRRKQPSRGTSSTKPATARTGPVGGDINQSLLRPGGRKRSGCQTASERHLTPRTKSLHKPWEQPAVARLLTSEKYAGRWDR